MDLEKDETLLIPPLSVEDQEDLRRLVVRGEFRFEIPLGDLYFGREENAPGVYNIETFINAIREVLEDVDHPFDPLEDASDHEVLVWYLMENGYYVNLEDGPLAVSYLEE